MSGMDQLKSGMESKVDNIKPLYRKLTIIMYIVNKEI